MPLYERDNLLTRAQLAVALLCGGSKKHLHQGGLSTDQLLPLSYEKISAVDRSDLSDYTYMVLGGAGGVGYSSSSRRQPWLFGFHSAAAAPLTLAFPDGEGARRADRVDYLERSEVVRFRQHSLTTQKRPSTGLFS